MPSHQGGRRGEKGGSYVEGRGWDGKTMLAQHQNDVAEKEKALSNELEKCQSFILRISKNYFYQGLPHAAFFHGIPLEDDRYVMNKDVVDG